MEAVEAASHRPIRHSIISVPWRGVVVITTSWHQERSCFTIVNQLSQLNTIVNQLSQLKVGSKVRSRFHPEDRQIWEQKKVAYPKKTTILFHNYRKNGSKRFWVESGHVPSGRTTIVIFFIWTGPQSPDLLRHITHTPRYLRLFLLLHDGLGPLELDKSVVSRSS
jgi:hypothetical protein